MTNSEKALCAVRDLYLVQQEIKAATKQIGEALVYCTNRVANTAEDVHLLLAYRTPCGDVFYNKRSISDGEITDILSKGGELECPHCLKAHQLVLHRKALKKKRGTIRRQITMIGRSAVKGGAA